MNLFPPSEAFPIFADIMKKEYEKILLEEIFTEDKISSPEEIFTTTAGTGDTRIGEQ
jgi:hypothetical protein